MQPFENNIVFIIMHFWFVHNFLKIKFNFLLYRIFLGESGTPAQWPDCCRLVEEVCVHLCRIHQGPRQVMSRWGSVLKDYRVIRDTLLNCHSVMEKTTMALMELNQHTLKQW